MSCIGLLFVALHASPVFPSSSAVCLHARATATYVIFVRASCHFSCCDSSAAHPVRLRSQADPMLISLPRLALLPRALGRNRGSHSTTLSSVHRSQHRSWHLRTSGLWCVSCAPPACLYLPFVSTAEHVRRAVTNACCDVGPGHGSCWPSSHRIHFTGLVR